MADEWQTSNAWKHHHRPMAVARSQLYPTAHQYVVQPHPHLQAQLSQLQVPAHPQSQATGSSSLNNTPPIDNLNNILCHFVDSLNRLAVQQQYFNESLAKSDRRLEELLSSVSSVRETSDGLTKKLDDLDGIKETLERNSRSQVKEKEVDVMKVLVGEMKAFKKTLGKSCDGDDGRTVLGRLDAVTFAVGELLERARDPEANLPGPSTSTTAQPCIIDLTRSSSPLVSPTSPVHSGTYVDVGISPVPSPLPLKERSIALIRASSRCSSEPFTHYPCRPSSAHTIVNDSTTSPSPSPDTASDLTQDNLELVYPIPMDEDTIDSTEPTIDSQTLPAVSHTQKIAALSNASVTTTETPHIETIRTATAMHSSMPSDLASSEDAQNSQNITTNLDDTNDKPADIHDARLLNVTPGPGPDIQTLNQLASTSTSSASTSSASNASPAITPTPFTQTEVQCSADKANSALGASAQPSPYLGNINSSVSEGKQQQKEQSQKQKFSERLESPLSSSTRDEETPSLDKINSDELNMSTDGKGYKEVKFKAMTGAEENKNIEKRTPIELNGNRIGDVPASTPALIDLSQFLRRRRSSSRFASPSTSLSSLSIRGRTGSRPSVNSPDFAYSPSLPSDTKLSLMKTKILAGAGVSRSSAAPPPTPPAAASPFAPSVITRTPVTTSIEKAPSVSSHSAFPPTTTNAELVATTIQPATPTSIVASPTISATKINTPAASESSHLHLESTSASAVNNKPLHLSQTSTLPAATSTPTVLTISPTTPPSALSQLGPVGSPPAMFDDLPTPSQASTNMTQDEFSVSRMVIEKEKENEGEAGNLVEKTIGENNLKMASRKFEKEEEEEEEEEEKQPDRPSSLSLSPLSTLSPSISGSPYSLRVKTSRPSTNLPRCALFLTPLPRSPLASASASSKNQTQIDQALESPSPLPTSFFPVVSSSSSSTTIHPFGDEPESQSPLFSSPSSNKLKTPDDKNSTTNPTILNTPSKATASTLTHIPTQVSASIETILPRDLSPISEIEKGKGTVEKTDKTLVETVYTSLGDNADIVVKKRKVSEGSGVTVREPLVNPVAKGKGKEIDDLEVETKLGEAVKKRSLLNLKAGKKGDSLAVTRVKKRKARPDFVVDVDGEANGVGQRVDGLDEERPLKRARQRVSDNQTKPELGEKGKQISKQFSESTFGAGTSTTSIKPRSSVFVKKGSPSKARLSQQGKAEVEWPTITEECKDVDLVGCDKCKAWYHYGCVGLSAGDKRLRGGGKFFCPPCEAGTTIKKSNLYSDCWRPGCSISTGYIVEKIIGRFKKFVTGKKYQFKYLLQWKGYKLSESSWEPEESMFDPSYMIEKFRADTLKEGIDIDKEETGLILLQVAKDPSVPQPT